MHTVQSTLCLSHLEIVTRLEKSAYQRFASHKKLILVTYLCLMTFSTLVYTCLDVSGKSGGVIRRTISSVAQFTKSI